MSSRMISWHRSLAAANTSSSTTPITGSTPIIEQPSSQSLLKTEDVPNEYSAQILSELVQICKPNAASVKSIQAKSFQQGPAVKISDAADPEKLMMNPALGIRSSWSLTLMDPERVTICHHLPRKPRSRWWNRSERYNMQSTLVGIARIYG